MPTAFTVAGAFKTNVPPLARYCAVPEPGTGVEPSVVYQMPVFLIGAGLVRSDGGSVTVKVTFNGNV